MHWKYTSLKLNQIQIINYNLTKDRSRKMPVGFPPVGTADREEKNQCYYPNSGLRSRK